MFEGEAHVSIRDPEQFLRFINGIFSQPGFFPGYGRSTSFTENGDEVKAAAAEDLFTRMNQLLFGTDTRSPNDWPSCPFLRLAVTFDDLDVIDRASKANPQECAEATRNILEKSATVLRGDAFAARLFGMQGPESLQGANFGELVSTWRGRCPTPTLDWLQSLADSSCGPLRTSSPASPGR